MLIYRRHSFKDEMCVIMLGDEYQFLKDVMLDVYEKYLAIT